MRARMQALSESSRITALHGSSLLCSSWQPVTPLAFQVLVSSKLRFSMLFTNVELMMIGRRRLRYGSF